MQLNTVEIAKILGYGGEIAAAEITEVSTDSRKVGVGTLFVALKGERFDGHDFILFRALRTGCTGYPRSAGQRGVGGGSGICAGRNRPGTGDCGGGYA